MTKTHQLIIPWLTPPTICVIKITLLSIQGPGAMVYLQPSVTHNTHTHTHRHTHAHAHTQEHTHMYTWTHTHVHTHAHTCTHTGTHTHTLHIIKIHEMELDEQTGAQYNVHMKKMMISWWHQHVCEVPSLGRLLFGDLESLTIPRKWGKAVLLCLLGGGQRAITLSHCHTNVGWRKGGRGRRKEGRGRRKGGGGGRKEGLQLAMYSIHPTPYGRQ